MQQRNSEKGQGAVVLILILVVLALAAICAASGNAVITDQNGAVVIGKPEQFAQATAISRAADLAREATREAVSFEATVNAANGQATATAAAVSVNATSTAIAQVAAATATAAPYQAAIAQNEASAKVVNLWAVTVLGVIGGGVAALSIAFAFAAWLRTRSRVAWVGANGPVLIMGDSVIDAGKMIGPAVSVPGDDKLIEVERLRHYLATGQIITKPLAALRLTDGGATADHYLEAARVAGHTNAIGAMFRPDNADRGREEKLDILERRQQAAPSPVLHSPLPRITVIDDPRRIEEFGRLLESEGQ